MVVALCNVDNLVISLFTLVVLVVLDVIFFLMDIHFVIAHLQNHAHTSGHLDGNLTAFSHLNNSFFRIGQNFPVIIIYTGLVSCPSGCKKHKFPCCSCCQGFRVLLFLPSSYNLGVVVLLVGDTNSLPTLGYIIVQLFLLLMFQFVLF